MWPQKLNRTTYCLGGPPVLIAVNCGQTKWNVPERALIIRLPTLKYCHCFRLWFVAQPCCALPSHFINVFFLNKRLKRLRICRTSQQTIISSTNTWNMRLFLSQTGSSNSLGKTDFKKSPVVKVLSWYDNITKSSFVMSQRKRKRNRVRLFIPRFNSSWEKNF